MTSLSHYQRPMKANKNPIHIRKRVIYLSLFNGWSIALFAGICTVASMFFEITFLSLFVGLTITAAGFLELIGGQRLRDNKSHPFRLLCGSQVLFFVSLTVYCIIQTMTLDVYQLMESIPPAILQQVMDGAQADFVTIGIVFEFLLKVFYSAVILASLVYQGGIFVYYYTRIKYMNPKISDAVATEGRSGHINPVGPSTR